MTPPSHKEIRLARFFQQLGHVTVLTFSKDRRVGQEMNDSGKPAESVALAFLDSLDPENVISFQLDQGAATASIVYWERVPGPLATVEHNSGLLVADVELATENSAAGVSQ